MNSESWRRAALAAALLLSACALGPGNDNTAIDAALIAGGVDGAGRETADGWLRLSSDYQLRFDAVEVTLGGLELQRLAASGGGGTFDPENPPAGYSCHGGHCHTPDGRLIPYDEVAAELSGGGGFQPVVTFSNAVGVLDVLETAVSSRALECSDGCVLSHGTVTRVAGSLTALRFSGRVRDGRATPRFEGERSWSFELPEEDTPLSLSVPTELVSDRFSPSRLALRIELTASPLAFDAVDWAALEPSGAGELLLDSEANHERLDELLARLQTGLLRAAVTLPGDSAFDPYF